MYTILESFCEGKKSPETCEDRLVVTPHFVAVVDGATSSGVLANGKAGGIVAAEAVAEVIKTLAPTATIQTFAETATQAVATATGDWPDPAQNRPCASVVVYSAARQEIWRIGDPHFQLDDTPFIGEKEIDAIAYRFRSTVVRARMMLGVSSIAAEQSIPVLEAAHRPLTSTQGAYANHPTDPLGYGVVNGTPIPPAFLEVTPAQGVRQIILCSDGFFTPPATLAEGLAELERLKKDDPLLCFTVNGSRPFPPNGRFFDDTTYIRLRITTG